MCANHGSRGDCRRVEVSCGVLFAGVWGGGLRRYCAWEKVSGATWRIGLEGWVALAVILF